MTVVVTHPGRQHSHQAALALERAGMLAGYFAGVPCLERQRRRIPPGLWRRYVHYAPVPLPPAKVRWFPLTPALRRLGDAVLPGAGAAWADFAACRLFDRWAAGWLARRRPLAVVACEISALSTFRAARRLGIRTILDAPSLHHRAQDRLQRFSEPPRLHRRITRVKDREIALADDIVTVSELAQASYLEGGVPARRVHAVLLGADTELFSPPASGATAEPPAEFTFLFPGAMIRRKGFDLLLAAFAQVRRAEPGVRLLVAGPPGDASPGPDSRGTGGVCLLGRVDQARLAELMRSADCLVLPSRHDSYGLVVAEALAAGLPVVVSEQVGAKVLVRPGENGWILPAEDAGALARQLLWCARHRRAVRRLREACRRSAEAATWGAYHRRFAELIATLLRESTAP